ncbi:helix-turn-helix transcriptional regulator [Vibrio sp. PNB22_4_1]
MNEQLNTNQSTDRIIREPERLALTGISKTTWWEKEKKGELPKRISLGARSVGWRLSDINAWLDSLS